MNKKERDKGTPEIWGLAREEKLSASRPQRVRQKTEKDFKDKSPLTLSLGATIRLRIWPSPV